MTARTATMGGGRAAGVPARQTRRPLRPVGDYRLRRPPCRAAAACVAASGQVRRITQEPAHVR